MTTPAKPLPRFRTEAQERAFWETEGRDSTQHLDWAKAQRVVSGVDVGGVRRLDRQTLNRKCMTSPSCTT